VKDYGATGAMPHRRPPRAVRCTRKVICLCLTDLRLRPRALWKRRRPACSGGRTGPSPVGCTHMPAGLPAERRRSPYSRSPAVTFAGHFSARQRSTARFQNITKKNRLPNLFLFAPPDSVTHQDVAFREPHSDGSPAPSWVPLCPRLTVGLCEPPDPRKGGLSAPSFLRLVIRFHTVEVPSVVIP